MSVKTFENNRWSREDQKLEFRHRATLSMIDRGPVLDLGSGDGLLLSLFKDKGISGKGLDISEEGTNKAKAKGLDVEVFDFTKTLPFADGSFHAVVMLDLLEHLYDPESLLKEAVRVSNKYVVVGVPNFSSLPARIQTLRGIVPENNRPKKGHIFWFNYPVLKAMLSKAGLKTVKWQSNTFLESAPIISVIVKFVVKIVPSIFGLSYVVLVKKST